jgi:FkbM family methyltransferase
MDVIGNWLRFFGRRRVRSFALNELDRKLERFLNFDGGFFVEAGANDGLRQSNTWYFERYRRWSGLLVEPVPELARRCRKNRRRCIVENVALVPLDFDRPYVELTYCDLMSQVKGAMKTAEDERKHLELGCQIQKVRSYDFPSRAKPLSVLLDEHRIRRIDLLSLDVEGYELPVLQGLDFQRHRPHLMLIEARFRNEIERYLQPWYEPVAELSHHDVLYRCAVA